LQAVRLAGLAHHERVQRLAARGGRVHHGGGHRVGTQREPADGVVGQVGGEVQHHLAGQRRASPAEQDPPQVDVPARLLPRRQHEVTVHDRVLPDCFP
jgi:hypothetical protein